jgi:hypothetical protein
MTKLALAECGPEYNATLRSRCVAKSETKRAGFLLDWSRSL